MPDVLEPGLTREDRQVLRRVPKITRRTKRLPTTDDLKRLLTTDDLILSLRHALLKPAMIEATLLGLEHLGYVERVKAPGRSDCWFRTRKGDEAIA